MTHTNDPSEMSGPRPQRSSGARRRRSRQPSRHRFLPQLQFLEDRRVPTSLLVNSLADSGVGTLRDAITASLNHTTDGLGQTGTGNDTIRFSAAIDGGTISLSSYVNDVTPGSK